MCQTAHIKQEQKVYCHVSKLEREGVIVEGEAKGGGGGVRRLKTLWRRRVINDGNFEVRRFRHPRSPLSSNGCAVYLQSLSTISCLSAL